MPAERAEESSGSRAMPAMLLTALGIVIRDSA